MIGDPVNEAARLTELAKTTEGGVLASEAIVALAGAHEARRWRLGEPSVLRGPLARDPRRRPGLSAPATEPCVYACGSGARPRGQRRRRCQTIANRRRSRRSRPAT